MITDFIEHQLIIRHLGLQDYLTCWEAMKKFTAERTANTPDEIWLVEHNPVFTQGQNGKAEHILSSGTIPIIQTDRGGQVTYHGPGQLIAYTLIDLRRKKFNVREMISALENTIINLLKDYKIIAYAKREAPGVYITDKKIASVGLRISRGCSYHGLALNVAMDVTPFTQINPCGLKNLDITQLKDFIPTIKINTVTKQLIDWLIRILGYNAALNLGK